MTIRVSASCIALACILLATSCRDLYTSSLAKPLARDSIEISDSTSVSTLMDLVNSSYSDTPSGTKALLDALAEKPASDITSLPIEDKTAVLDMATTAALDLGSLMDTITDLEGKDGNDIVTELLDSFDTSVNLGVVETLLADPEVLQEAEVDTLVFAAAVVIADLIAGAGSDAIMDILATPGNVSAYPDLTAGQIEQINLVLGVVGALESRPDIAEESDYLGFDLLSLLQGNQT